MGDVRIPSRPSLEIREADDEAASQGDSPSPSPHSGTSAIRISVKLLAPDVASESLSSSHSMESLSNESTSVVGGSGSGIAGRNRGNSGNKHNLPQLMIPVSPLKKKSASVRSKGRLTASSGTVSAYQVDLHFLLTSHF